MMFVIFPGILGLFVSHVLPVNHAFVMFGSTWLEGIQNQKTKLKTSLRPFSDDWMKGGVLASLHQSPDSRLET